MSSNHIILLEKFSEAASTNFGRIHIISSKDGWNVKKEGALKAVAVKSTKDAAVKIAKNMKPTGEIIIHKRDGSIQYNKKAV